MSESTFTFESNQMKRVELATIEGRIDSSNAAEFDALLKGLVDDGKYQIVLDMSEVNYISSAGLRAMVALLREARKHRGDVRIATPSERVNEVLELSGLSELFTCYPDAIQAVGSF